MLHREAIVNTIAQLTPTVVQRYRDQLKEAHILWQQALAYDQRGIFADTQQFWSAGTLGLQVPLSIPHAIEGCVIAVDGSQIYSDRHMGSTWYLIHIGAVKLDYVKNGHSACTFYSYPFIYAPLPQEASVDTVNMVRLGRELVQGYDLLKSTDDPCSLLMFDGSLPEYGFAQPLLNSQQQAEYIKILDVLAVEKRRYVGYISAPQARDLVRLMFIEKQHNSLLTDRDIMRLWLKPGHYSTVFTSQTKIAADSYKNYFYWHNGYEIVRIEFPSYLGIDERLLASIMGMMQDQVEKGRGYPLCLAEAHQYALVNEADRLFFYQMIDHYYQKQGEYCQPSQKNVKKRTLYA